MSEFQPIYRIEVTRWEYTFMTLTVHIQGSHRMEFRGDAYWQWNLSSYPDHIRNHGKAICWAQLLHDSLEGWHSCVLHAGDIVTILPRHPDYEAVTRLIHWGETLSNQEVAALLQGEQNEQKSALSG
jgi:hypothetical protein